MDDQASKKLEKERSRGLDGTLVGYLHKLAALAIELDQRLGLLVVSLQAIQYGGRLIILADGKLTAAAVTNALFGTGFVDDVVAGAAFLHKRGGRTCGG